MLVNKRPQPVEPVAQGGASLPLERQRPGVAALTSAELDSFGSGFPRLCFLVRAGGHTMTPLAGD